MAGKDGDVDHNMLLWLLVCMDKCRKCFMTPDQLAIDELALDTTSFGNNDNRSLTSMARLN